jgi:molybdopterin/thiamine biosynthesis adenylyltransferase
MSEQALREAVLAAATDGTFPDGRAGRFLSAAAEAAVVRDCGVSPRRVQIAALENGVCPLRYARNLHALTLAEQARLLASRAALVGLGGLGGGLLETLVRSGVGSIAAADGDVFDETNLNRQLLSDCAAVGVSKAVVAAARARAVNPAVEFTARGAFLDQAGMAALLDGADVAVDALGGLADRPALAAAAADRGIPLVTAAVAGYTIVIATALPHGPSPLALFGGGAGTPAENALGCPGPAVMAAAALQAAETVRLLAGRAPALAGKALIMDLETMRCDTVTF